MIGKHGDFYYVVQQELDENQKIPEMMYNRNI